MSGTDITKAVIDNYSIMRISPSMIYFRVRLEYDDVFRRHHWTQLCGKHLPYSALDRFDQCLVGIGVDQP